MPFFLQLLILILGVEFCEFLAVLLVFAGLLVVGDIAIGSGRLNFNLCREFVKLPLQEVFPQLFHGIGGDFLPAGRADFFAGVPTGILR